MDPASPAAASSTETAGRAGVTPRLAVIVVSFSPEPMLGRCLDALASQARPSDGIETVVVRARRNGAPTPSDRIRQQFPHVRFFEAPAACPVPAMRAIGIARTGAPVVALIEDDCVVQQNWTDEVRRAHQGPEAAVGGAVEPGPFERGLDWGVFFCDYGRFMLPLSEGPAAALAGNNMSYKRAALADLPEVAAGGLQEAFVCRAFRRLGVPMRTAPSVVVVNAGSWSWAHVTRVPFHHGRAYAGRRVEGFPVWRRAAIGLLALGLPALKVVRVSREVLIRKRRVGPLVRSLPWIAVLATSWSLGECAGYLFGPGESLSKWQ